MLTGKRTREFNPGPASTSRKKRAQVGARGLPRKPAVKVPFFDVATRTKKFEAKKRARQAIGARGVKTNARRTRKALRVPYKVVEATIQAAIESGAIKIVNPETPSPTTDPGTNGATEKFVRSTTASNA